VKQSLDLAAPAVKRITLEANSAWTSLARDPDLTILRDGVAAQEELQALLATKAFRKRDDIGDFYVLAAVLSDRRRHTDAERPALFLSLDTQFSQKERGKLLQATFEQYRVRHAANFDLDAALAEWKRRYPAAPN
jgi:hypothetical protein